MGNVESSSSLPFCGRPGLGTLRLPRQEDKLVFKVQHDDDATEVSFLTWLDEDGSTTVTTTRTPLHGSDSMKSHDTPGTTTTTTAASSSSPEESSSFRSKDSHTHDDNSSIDKSTSSLQLAEWQLAQANQRIQQLERLRKADQELLRTLNIKLKHLLHVQADYYLARRQQDDEDKDDEEP